MGKEGTDQMRKGQDGQAAGKVDSPVEQFEAKFEELQQSRKEKSPTPWELDANGHVVENNFDVKRSEAVKQYVVDHMKDEFGRVYALRDFAENLLTKSGGKLTHDDCVKVSVEVDKMLVDFVKDYPEYADLAKNVEHALGGYFDMRAAGASKLEAMRYIDETGITGTLDRLEMDAKKLYEVTGDARELAVFQYFEDLMDSKAEMVDEELDNQK